MDPYFVNHLSQIHSNVPDTQSDGIGLENEREYGRYFKQKVEASDNETASASTVIGVIFSLFGAVLDIFS